MAVGRRKSQRVRIGGKTVKCEPVAEHGHGEPRTGDPTTFPRS